MSAEAHNALYGPALIVQVMDHLRKMHPQEPTLWSLNKHLCDLHQVHGEEERNKVYERVRTVVKNMKAGGLVTTRNERDQYDRPHKYIALCQSSTA